ncbi:hypothetical protein R8Z57_00180 [Microbacterium sp. M3]|uniref:DUF7882 domain-containing protein n=1 Tax=Microbacterium arthrosphaerae TaxID=792652 RepID=A0ABU4GXR0_9MICO|nr:MULTISPECIES: hypothetical protein [Microbacterium]MDW4571190.1 hypothetical protein [Microbacterium arthrosphaerae]MDW7605045.1 hypothetical protein [Microbacterium sp. M3]
MAELIYGTEGEPIHIPEHLLAHVKVVVTAKLRRNESFMMTWRHADGTGRSAVWLQPSIPLRFVFDDAEAPAIDHQLLQALAAAANSNGGLVLDLGEAGSRTRPARMPQPHADAFPRVAQPAA